MDTRYLRFGGLARFGWLCLSLSVVLAGCSGNPYQKSQPYYLEQIHAPHLAWLSAVSRIPQSDGTKGGVIYGLTPLQRPGSSRPQFIVNVFGSLYLINEDGSGLHPVNMGGYCQGSAEVTADGEWIACVTTPDNDNGYDRLLVAALHPDGISQVHQVQLSDLPFYHDISWSPDGRYLAAQIEDVGGMPTIDIFYSPPPHTSFVLAITLNSDLFTTEFCCDGDSILWASNSQLLLVHPDRTQTTVTQVSLANALQAFNDSQSSSPVTQFVASQEFKPVYNGAGDILLPPLGFGKPPFDTRQSSLVLLSGAPMTLFRLDLRTGRKETLLNTPGDVAMLIVGWMPDGRDLFIVAGGYRCVDCFAYPVSDVYVYSMRASSSSSQHEVPAG